MNIPIKIKIIIFTINSDLSTDRVIDWLNYFGCKVYRYNIDTDIDKNVFFNIHINNKEKQIELIFDNEKINIKDVKSIWFRKFLNPDFKEILLLDEEEFCDTHNIYNHITREYRSSLHTLFSLLPNNNKILGGRIARQPTKIEMLQAAKSFGITIPDTIFTSKKSELIRFIKKHKEVITKTIKDGDMFIKQGLNNNKIHASTYTELLNEGSLEKIPNHFFTSQFQEKINKEVEIRSFYLNGKFYSSAIFSQLDQQTNVDFRMYNNKKPNRTVPYKLSNKIESKLIKLMDFLELKTGSIDLVKTKDDKTVFLEINPWGQYGMVSRPCNFELNKKVAQYLINNN